MSGESAIDVAKHVATSEMTRGILFGASGGLIVSLVSRASMAEVLARMAVGGVLAATISPWVAETVLKVEPTSTAYPVLCCTIGVLGYQIVQKILHDPSIIPVIGPALARFSKAPEDPPNGGHTPPPDRVPAQHTRISEIFPPAPPVPPAPARQIRVPLAS